ncbi:NAD-dependent epimerase/dehydratase family protein [Terrabacter sp. GCM10028922]|uniref:NAD-dependent epimerase/dehydratase family protein n=1 Tax=Terrabacter sp. GCM10028922 TaxID=3273428 RepID=UPI0036169ED8
MRLLVLGGTHHVGRAFVETALARGDEVTTVTRGVSGVPVDGAEARHANRLDPDAMRQVLGDDEWDAVVDTWSDAPVAVQTSARLLSGRTPHYTYISSRSVYSWPLEPDSDESAPVVEGDPSSTDGGDYAAAKRGGELAVLDEFDGDVALARAGLILGPYENVGRMPFWLNRIASGGRVPAPGPYDRPLQYIDCRDIAGWVLGSRPVGTFNTVSEAGHTTMGALLDEVHAVTGSDAELVWVEPSTVEAAEVSPWTELPIWVPPTGEYIGLHSCDVSAAYASGLRPRPMPETVADTWAWLQREGVPEPRTGRAGGPMDAAAEERLLAIHDATT